MSIQQQVIVRHRSAGYLRLQLPPQIGTPQCGYLLVKGLQSMEGIYRVRFEEKHGKLSIHFQETVCTVNEVATRLHRLINDLPAQNPAATAEGLALTANGWLQGKIGELRETIQATGIIARQMGKLVGSFAGTNWINEFLNDLLMLYLIKMHWPSITQLWLPHPWRYRYEWTATFYLIYLHVKSKLPKPS
ncbi:MAG: hypothetical protein ACR2HF_05245 [Methylococcaceae bacterium]